MQTAIESGLSAVVPAVVTRAGLADAGLRGRVGVVDPGGVGTRHRRCRVRDLAAALAAPSALSHLRAPLFVPVHPSDCSSAPYGPLTRIGREDHAKFTPQWPSVLVVVERDRVVRPAAAAGALATRSRSAGTGAARPRAAGSGVVRTGPTRPGPARPRSAGTGAARAGVIVAATARTGASRSPWALVTQSAAGSAATSLAAAAVLGRPGVRPVTRPRVFGGVVRRTPKPYDLGHRRGGPLAAPGH